MSTENHTGEQRKPINTEIKKKFMGATFDASKACIIKGNQRKTKVMLLLRSPGRFPEGKSCLCPCLSSLSSCLVLSY